MQRRIINFLKIYKYLALIIILAAVLRFAAISDNPPSLNWDEVSHGYNAYSILKTGKDEWGVTLPTIFRAYGDYKLPVYIYLTSLSVSLFGLSAFAVRLPSVLAGITTVIFTYLLVNELFGYGLSALAKAPSDRRVAGSKKYNAQRVTQNRLTALTASLLVAIEPWSLFLSRGAFEANLALAFIVSGVYFFLKGLHATSYMLLATILLGLSVWTYNSARVFVPLLLLLMIVVYRRELRFLYKKSPITIHWSLVTALALLVPMFWQMLSPAGQARHRWVAILDEGAIAQINEARNNSSLSPSLTMIVYNKGTYFVSRFVNNWVSHYSGNFLFFKGGSHYQFSVPGHGLLYPINALFLIIGVFSLLKKRTKESILILAWFFIGPVASSLTREAPMYYAR